ncbi:unnamed protein product [Rotaria sp. Silwood1]|nr:unnamed protein product [Rotaria sp. Silwood1]
MIKQATKPDYSKMSEGELKLLLKKHQQLLNNTRLINGLPDKGQRIHNAIAEIEKFLAVPSSPMDCDTITNQFSQMTMSSNDNEIINEKVHLEKPVKDSIKTTINNDFSDERLNEVKQRLKARQAERDIGETLEAALGQEGDSEEEDAIVNQVLDEIGISLNEKVANAPRVPVAASSVAATRRQTNDEDAEIEKMLANLK